MAVSLDRTLFSINEALATLIDDVHQEFRSLPDSPDSEDNMAGKKIMIYLTRMYFR